jgi:hypothetical protein
MTSVARSLTDFAARSLTDFAARTLKHDEREVVLGDLAERSRGVWRDLGEVLGLVVRREAALWSDWRPWLAAFGVALPSTLLLMGRSFSISCAYRQLAQEDFLLFLCQVVLLLIWSWAVGFVVGSVSRRTLWVSIVVSLIPCVRCLSMFHEASLSRLCLLLFLPPAILGVISAWKPTSSQ